MKRYEVQNSIETQLPLLRELARRYGTTPRVVGDSKLVSHEVMVKFEESGLEFLSPEPSSKELKELYKRFGKDLTSNWVELDYVSESASQKEGEMRVYKGLELEFEYELVEQKGQTYRKGTPVQQAPKPKGGRPSKAKRAYQFRRILIFSSTNQMAQRKNRERYFSRLESSLEQLNEKFRTPWWINKTQQRAQQAVNLLLKSSKLGHLYRCELTRNPDEYWELEWAFDEVAHSELESLDGFYSLVTNIPKGAENLSKTYRDYKKQIDSERRFADWKGPLHVCSVFLKNNKRIVGMVFVLSIALLVFSLLEREVRRQLPDGKMKGLLPVAKPMRATGSNILNTLRGINVVNFKLAGQSLWQCPEPNHVQRRLLKLLSVDLNLPENRGSPS